MSELSNQTKSLKSLNNRNELIELYNNMFTNMYSNVIIETQNQINNTNNDAVMRARNLYLELKKSNNKYKFINETETEIVSRGFQIEIEHDTNFLISCANSEFFSIWIFTADIQLRNDLGYNNAKSVNTIDEIHEEISRVMEFIKKRKTLNESSSRVDYRVVMYSDCQY